MTPERMRDILQLCKRDVDTLEERQLKDRELARRFWFNSGCSLSYLREEATDEDLLELWVSFALEATEELR